jgi:nucleotide-binding universal stress UspA family protein
MFKNILIPTDGSAESHKAAHLGVELAKAVGAKVTGFFAAPPATPIVEKTAAKYLDYIARAAEKEGVEFEGLHATNDYPADAILDIARKKKCDLIVMATHSGGGLREVFIGSVTQKVLHQSKVPVMVLR